MGCYRYVRGWQLSPVDDANVHPAAIEAFVVDKGKIL